MLTIHGRTQRVCNGFSRRALLQAGGAGLLGLNVPQLLAAEQGGAAFREGRAKSVIFLFLFGGPSQLETFDLKPDAPAKIRGPFQPIASRTPDLRLSEHLPRTAELSDKFCVIRTLTHDNNDHNACHYIQTGHPWGRVLENGQDVNARPTDWPAIGSVVEYLSVQQPGTRQRTLPDYMYLPNRLGHLQVPKYDRTGQYAGWLGASYNGLATDVRPREAKDNLFLRDCTDEELDFRIKGLASTTEVSLDRIDRRRNLLDQFDGARRALDQSRRYQVYDDVRGQALDLITSETIRTALDIRREPAALRDRYGRHLFGQSVLMARRMVEAGTRFVTVGFDSTTGLDGWDSHTTSEHLQKGLVPSFDQAYSALLEDLEQRGLLAETLVVALGEMGRTPAATPTWGRGHWSYCFPALLAGAGVRGGIAYGRSDADAAWPAEKATAPEDLAATIYHALGIDQHVVLPDPQGRPVPALAVGRPLIDLFG